ncbi:MAG: TVP38/TMEM64 family protein [Chthoniobacterales bacterium]|nr:TVP38/TMEM64 family protein [Chthoniobacterales bacterium]
MRDFLRSPVTRWGAVALFLIAAVVAARVLPLMDWINAFREWSAQLGPAGPLIYGVVFGAAAILMLPCLPLTIVAGFTFGWAGGTLAVMLGIAIGSAFGFLAVRLSARGAVAKRLERHPRFKAIDHAIAQEGWKIVGLLRMCPVPFGITNYLYGLTAIDFPRYMVATMGGMLPGTVMFVYLGAFGQKTLEGPRHPLEWVMGGLTLLAMFGVVILLRNIAKRATAAHFQEKNA